MKYRSHRLLVITALSSAAVLTLSACSGGGTSNQGPDKTAPTKLSGTVSLWTHFSDREAKALKSVTNQFEKLHPGVTVELHEGQADDKMAKVIASGSSKIDIINSSGTDNLGAFCGSGSVRDLGPYIKRDSVDISKILEVPRTYTAFDGKQCSLPMMTDMYGLYYNKDLFASAGITAPPKTLSELENDALALTTYKADGSIEKLGFNPLIGFYENNPAQWTFFTGASWMKNDKSTIADDPAWEELMTWQKGFIDKIGYDKLKAFTAGLGDEWSGDQAFQTGQVAMTMDGEWRVAFIEDQKPDLNYGTAPFPTGDNHSDIYGGGYSSGDILGIAKGSANPEAAWALIKYLSTDTGVQVKLANEIKNIPAWGPAATSPDLKLTPQFKTFFDIANSGHVVTLPTTIIGSANQTAMQNYWEKYQSGQGGDLSAGLKKVDEDINNSIALSKGP